MLPNPGVQSLQLSLRTERQRDLASRVDQWEGVRSSMLPRVEERESGLASPSWHAD